MDDVKTQRLEKELKEEKEGKKWILIISIVLGLFLGWVARGAIYKVDLDSWVERAVPQKAFMDIPSKGKCAVSFDLIVSVVDGEFDFNTNHIWIDYSGATCNPNKDKGVE